MGLTWKSCVHIILAVTIVNSPKVIAQDEGLELSDKLYPDNEFLDTSLDKRLSRFVRIGRALSSFVRIGKSDPNQIYDNELDDTFGLNNGGEPVEKRQSAFVRIGRGNDEFDGYPEKRLSSFVRIGRGGEAEMDDVDPMQFQTASKRGSAFIRMGKFPTSAYLRHRNGIIRRIDPNPYYRRNGRIGHSSFIRIGKRDTTDALRKLEEERKDRYLRLGKSEDDVNDENMEKRRMSNFVRIGRGNNDENMEKRRMSNFVRIGRGNDDESISEGGVQPSEDKRASRFVRIGKALYPITDDKRMSSFVRIGRMPFVPTDKRYSKFVRIGKSLERLDDDLPEKRLSNFVRIGKSNQTPDVPMSEFGNENIDKVQENFEADSKEKIEEKRRMSSFVRIGRDQTSDMKASMNERPSNPEKRALSSFVRIGKREAVSDLEAGTDDGHISASSNVNTS